MMKEASHPQSSPDTWNVTPCLNYFTGNGAASLLPGGRYFRI